METKKRERLSIEDFIPDVGDSISRVSGYHLTAKEISECGNLNHRTVSACIGGSGSTSVSTYRRFCEAVDKAVEKRKKLMESSK